MKFIQGLINVFNLADFLPLETSDDYKLYNKQKGAFNNYHTTKYESNQSYTL